MPLVEEFGPRKVLAPPSRMYKKDAINKKEKIKRDYNGVTGIVRFGLQ